MSHQKGFRERGVATCGAQPEKDSCAPCAPAPDHNSYSILPKKRAVSWKKSFAATKVAGNETTLKSACNKEIYNVISLG